jgi:hypothetical protein
MTTTLGILEMAKQALIDTGSTYIDPEEVEDE